MLGLGQYRQTESAVGIKWLLLPTQFPRVVR
jgi:hypothetical protein